MKKFLAGALLSVSALTLAACGEEESNQVSSRCFEHTTRNYFRTSKAYFEEQGIELVIEPYQDYVLPNKDLESGELDANYFQHIPYLEDQIATFGYDFVNAGGIHIEPIGLYSKKYGSIEELPEGATILMSNSIPDHGRILAMLRSKRIN